MNSWFFNIYQTFRKQWKNGTPPLWTFRRNDKFKNVAMWFNIPDWNLCFLSSPNLINLWDKFQAFEACFGNGTNLWNRFLLWTLTLRQQLKNQGENIVICIKLSCQASNPVYCVFSPGQNSGFFFTIKLANSEPTYVYI